MKDLKKKVMIINNFTSPYISEAIIVLKDYDPRFDTQAIDEAERIVNDYLDKKSGRPDMSDRRKAFALKSITIIFVMGICFAAGYLINH